MLNGREYRCTAKGCGAPVVGFLRPCGFGDPPEVYVGKPDRPTHLPVCSRHLADAMVKNPADLVS